MRWLQEPCTGGSRIRGGEGVSPLSPPAPASSRKLRTVTRRKLRRVVEIAEILGVSKQRADQLRRPPDFPARSIVGLEEICGRAQTFDGGRGSTPAARPGGVRALSRFLATAPALGPLASRLGEPHLRSASSRKSRPPMQRVLSYRKANDPTRVVGKRAYNGPFAASGALKAQPEQRRSSKQRSNSSPPPRSLSHQQWCHFTWRRIRLLV